MSLLSEIKAAVTGCGLPVETGVFSDEPPEEYVVVTPLADTYELHADNLPEYETQEARLSLFTNCLLYTSLPLHLYRYKEDGGKEKALDHPLYLLLHDEPNPEMSSFVFRETLMTHLLLWGNAYAQIIRNGKGEVIALYPLMPDRMTVNRDSNGQLYYEYTVSMDDAPTVKGSLVRLHPSDVLHIPGLGFDGLVGYSPIAMAKNAIGMAIACEEYGAKFFANGAAPGGVLEHPGTIKDPQRVRESWQSTFGGSGNSNKIAVLEEGMKYTPIGISPEQAQFLETRKFQINEIARIFRVPPHMLSLIHI